MTDSAPPEVASPSTLVARPAASRLAKFLAQLKRFRGPIAAIASIGAILSGIVGYWTAYDTVHHVVVPKSSPAAPPGPPIMLVAVMPFTPASASADDERLAERITQDVTSAIERALRYGLVASHALAVKYKAAPIDSRAAGRELNVRYLVEGDVRPAGGAVVVMVRLVETGNGAEVWNDRVTTPLSSSGESADDIVAPLTTRIRQAVYAAELKRAAHLPQAGANAMELALRGNALREQDHSPTAREAARKLYEEGLRLDPGSTMALLGLHDTIWRQWRDAPSADREQLMKEMDDVSTRAVRADRNDPRTWSSRAFTLAAQRQWDGAFEANAEALRIDPHRAPALGQRAWLLNLTGRAEEALPVLDQALALDPHSSNVPEYLRHQCTAYLVLGRYDNAILACGKALALGDEEVRLSLVAAYAQKGDMAKAAVEKAELLKRQPKTTIARLNRTWRLWSNNPIWLQQREAHILQGLRKAGIPES